MAKFRLDIRQGFGAAWTLKIFFEAAERHADDVSMMELRTKIVLEIEPEIVKALEVLRPEAGRVRTQVDVKRRTTSG